MTMHPMQDQGNDTAGMAKDAAQDSITAAADKAIPSGHYVPPMRMTGTHPTALEHFEDPTLIEATTMLTLARIKAAVKVVDLLVNQDAGYTKLGEAAADFLMSEFKEGMAANRSGEGQ